MVKGDAAFGHVGRDDGDLEVLRQCDELLTGPGQHDAAAHHQDRPLGLEEHLHGPPDLAGIGGRFEDLQGGVNAGIVLHFTPLDVQGQVDEHWAGPALACDPEGLAEHLGDLGAFLDAVGLLGHRFGNLGDVHRLEGLRMQPLGERLAGDAHDGDGVPHAGIEAGDHVGPGRPRRTDGNPDLARDPGPAVGGVGGALFVAHGQVSDLLGLR